MAQQEPTTVPIALSCTNSATITLPWFVQRTEYNPAPAIFKPLLNGKESFGAVYDAIENATASVDYICWAFQPSMYFKRDGGKSLRIGDLLIKVAQQKGVKVRILCWIDPFLLSQLSEQNVPEYSVFRPANTAKKPIEDDAEIEYDRRWFEHARRSASPNPAPAAQWSVDGPWPSSLRDIGIEFETRGFSLWTRLGITVRHAWAKLCGEPGITLRSILGYAAEPSHHQKAALIDYEAPERAVGFIMGHNTLDGYWDDNEHRYEKQAPEQGRNGLTPLQDLSTQLFGPILQYLNANFCQAWQRVRGQEELAQARKGNEKRLMPVHVQPQEPDKPPYDPIGMLMVRCQPSSKRRPAPGRCIWPPRPWKCPAPGRSVAGSGPDRVGDRGWI